MGKITYFVDGRAFETVTPELTVSDVLDGAGKPPKQFYLVHKDVEYHDPEKKIRIHDGDHFESRLRGHKPPEDKVIHYKVNGERQTTRHYTLTVEQILRNAGRAASIDVAQINDYYLESIDDGRKYESLTDRVAIREGNQFLALHRGKTPVA